MSFGGGSSGGGGTTQVTPYAPAQPALNQIISEAGNLYGQGVKASGYVAPTSQTTAGIANAEALAKASNTQIADTLSGKYLNPFLSPMLQGSANEIATAINSEFTFVVVMLPHPMLLLFRSMCRLYHRLGRLLDIAIDKCFHLMSTMDMVVVV